jgi:hypothetical protein
MTFISPSSVALGVAATGRAPPPDAWRYKEASCDHHRAPMTPTPDQEALAARLVDQALRDLSRALPPTALAELREFLIDEMLCTEEGMRRLRALEPPPIVARSDELLRPDVEPPAKKESGGT